MKTTTRRFAILLIPALFFCVHLNGQQLTVHTEKVEALIQKWDEAHNKVNPDAFPNLFDSQLVYYAEHVSQAKATLLKKLLFVRNPAYKQKISKDIRYTLHKNGVVKCEFTREVFRNGEWEASPMYLLVGVRNQGYWIIGESDPRTDSQYGYKPEIGEALEVGIVSTGNPSSNHLLSEVSVSPTNTIKENTKSVSYGNIHIYMVIALLGVGIFVIMLDRVAVKKEKARQEEHDLQMLEEEFVVVHEPKMPNEAYQVIENNLKHNSFRDYLLKLFDPVFFTLRTSEETTGQMLTPKVNNERKLLFNTVDSENPLTVYYAYREDAGSDIKLFPPEVLTRNAASADVYYVIGIGGPPDSPDDIYLIPAPELKEESVNKEFLKPFRKPGSFFYNMAVSRLQ